MIMQLFGNCRFCFSLSFLSSTDRAIVDLLEEEEAFLSSESGGAAGEDDKEKGVDTEGVEPKEEE